MSDDTRKNQPPCKKNNNIVSRQDQHKSGCTVTETGEKLEISDLCSENKGMISYTVTAKLICVFIFAYADCWFPHAKAQMSFYQQEIPLPANEPSREKTNNSGF